MDIKYSRRILAIGTSDSGVLDVIKELTGSAPSPDGLGSTAGLIHEWEVKTAYYSAKVPIWIDEIPEIAAWETEFLKDEAQEVVEALGAWMYCFRRPQDGKPPRLVEQTMKAVQRIAEQHAGYGGDSVMLAVAMPNSNAPANYVEAAFNDWEDICLRYGFEYIDFSAKGKNEFGEKVGPERLKEALESNEWAMSADENEELHIDSLDLDTLDDDDDDIGGFGREEAEMTAELFGMKSALMGGDDDELDADETLPAQATQVDDLDRMMGKILAIKESSVELPEVQRKKMAAKAVRELLGQDAGSRS